MRHLLLVISILFLAGISGIFGQDGNSSKPFIIHLSHENEPAALSIMYFMTGSFGGYGSFVRTDSKTWNYVIPTSNEEGKPAKKMRLIINSPKYQTRFFDLPESQDQDHIIDLKLLPRASLKFTGKVLSKKNLSGKRFQLRIDYLQEWQCAYFGLPDCMVDASTVTSGYLDKNGRFAVDLPDFASDPIIASLGDPGSFRFFLCDKKSGNIRYALQPENGRKSFYDIRVASSYPTEQIFTTKQWN